MRNNIKLGGPSTESKSLLSKNNVHAVTYLDLEIDNCDENNKEMYSRGSSKQLIWAQRNKIDLSSLELDKRKKTYCDFSKIKKRLPGLVIALCLNVCLSLSFGHVLFPSSWEFPPSIPRSIGVQMYLFSTIICQIVMSSMSNFPTALGMMMVETIPFMHAMCNIVSKHHITGNDAFSTVLIAFALCSLTIGIIFFLLGFFKQGLIVYFFPRHVIIGCIGGIGIFLLKSAIEVSTNITWLWSLESFEHFLKPEILQLWIVALLFEFGLLFIEHNTKSKSLSPFYFAVIPFAFHLFLYLSNLLTSSTTSNVYDRHQQLWFFETTPRTYDYWLSWELMDATKVNWTVVFQICPTILALALFSLMLMPVHIPLLSLNTNQDFDMNNELMTHGIASFISGVCGGLQNYICFTYSMIYYYRKGGGELSGYILALLTTVFFFLAPFLVAYTPRCMAGCILLHIGLKMSNEALIESFRFLDVFEYMSALLIIGVITGYGITTGLYLGMLFSAVTFTLQAGKHVSPIRRAFRASSLRSTKWRTPASAKILDEKSRHILLVQLQGHIFFGNATAFCVDAQRLLAEAAGDIQYFLLDFTQVLGIDSSAVHSLAKMNAICKRYGSKLVYSRGSQKGFPCAAPLSEHLLQLEKFMGYNLYLGIHVADSLDEALMWCEDDFIGKSRRASISSNSDKSNGHSSVRRVTNIEREMLEQELRVPEHLRQLHFALCHHESFDVVCKLMKYFKKEALIKDTVLWRQGDYPDKTILLGDGYVESYVEGEEETTRETIGSGHLIGEFGLLTDTPRRSTVIMKADTKEAFVLYRFKYEEMIKQDPYLAIVLSKICMGYLDHRVQHVANRVWGSHGVPV